MTSIVTPTIWHTGTHLLMDFVIKRKHKRFGVGQGNSFTHFHLDEKSEDPRIWGDFRFSCLRHPRRCAESWARRRNNFPEKSVTEFGYQWERLMEYWHPHIDAYLHVDHESRDADVARMAQLTGWDLTCDWPVSKRSGSMKGTHNIRIGDCPKVPQEFIDFYYGTIN